MIHFGMIFPETDICKGSAMNQWAFIMVYFAVLIGDRCKLLLTILIALFGMEGHGV